MACHVIHVVHAAVDDRWHLKHEGKSIARFDTKEEAEQAGKRRGDALFDSGQEAQLVVHREDGSIESECTYGLDPVRNPG